MKTGIIIQARMDSSRLPGKCLMNMDGKPMIAYLFESMTKCLHVDDVVLATTDRRVDAPLIELAEEYGVSVYMGSLKNVALRLLEAASCFGFDGFARVCGDSPLLDSKLVDRLIGIFKKSYPELDLVTNIIERTFPKGQSVEVFKTQAFAHAVGMSTRSDHREHAGSAMYYFSDSFNIHNVVSGKPWGNIQLSVDDARDFARVEKVVSRMTKAHWDYSYKEVVHIYGAESCVKEEAPDATA